MEKIEIKIEREIYKALKNTDVIKLIGNNLLKVEKTLQADRELFLLEKKKKLEEKLEEIEGELEELKVFYQKAIEDKKLMLTFREKLREENEELKKELEEKKREISNKT